ncbi:MAG: ATP-binding protein [Robiginitomaculum sp.]|nr:ATP-binding protein [Robiginitomaculum sp.]
MNTANLDMFSIIVTSGAVAFAVVVAFLFMRASAGRRVTVGRWRKRAAELDQKLAQVETIFASYPGLVLVWAEKMPDPEADWGEPTVYGSTAALASLVRFAEPGKPKEFARNLLNGLADHNTISSEGHTTTLRKLVSDLRIRGEAFSASIALPGNKLIEADGNVAGAQVVLWLEDASIRAGDEKAAISKFENEKLTALSDPVAFVEIMGKAPFPMWRLSGGGRIVWANTAYIEAVGAEGLSEIIEEQIYLDDGCAEQARQALDGNANIKDVRSLVLNGTHTSSLISMFPVSGGVAGMAVDASEAENLRAALKRHISAHDETLNNMGEAVVIFGADKRMNFHNHAFAKMFTLDENWFRERPTHEEWLDHLREKRRLPEHPNYREWQQAELAYYTDWPDETPDELWSMPDGRELRLVRMRDPQGGISLLFGDITDQMIMQSRFNTQINVQTATLDKLTEGVAVFGPDGRLKMHNAAFEAMWGLSEDDLKEEPRFRDLTSLFFELYHDREFWKDMHARTTDPSPEARRHVQGEINRSDDSILTYLSRPLPDGATLVAWEDVTSSRRTEAALRERAEAMEAADRLKTEFVGHVSYQLRTPLTTISGYSELLQSGAAGELEDKQAEYVFAIQSAAEDLTRTISDILDFSAIEADTIDLELGDVEIFELLEDALAFVAGKAEDNNIELVFSCPEDIGMIRADEKRIVQIVYNLLSNGLRFTKPGGRVELGASSEADGITIWVKDNGVGIPSEKQPQVFESFQSSRGGAGLGLALVERFVARHGGWIELESEEGKGTHIICHLPREAVLEGAEPELGF